MSKQQQQQQQQDEEDARSSPRFSSGWQSPASSSIGDGTMRLNSFRIIALKLLPEKLQHRRRGSRFWCASPSCTDEADAWSFPVDQRMRKNGLLAAAKAFFRKRRPSEAEAGAETESESQAKVGTGTPPAATPAGTPARPARTPAPTRTPSLPPLRVNLGQDSNLARSLAKLSCGREFESGRRRLVHEEEAGIPDCLGDDVAVVKGSHDPFHDFRQSMAEMVRVKGLRRSHELADLLRCFLSLNHPRFHKLIMAAFADVVCTLR